jgi:hypothetical protein
MALTGKGFFIWKIPNTENGDINAIATLAKAGNFSHVLIKVADAASSYNFDFDKGIDLAPPLAQALRARGIQVWGWHYVYGDDPIGEANKAIQRVQQVGLDGYVIDAEGEYKQAGKAAAASSFMSRIRSSLPNLPIALSSYRYPSLHPQLPWKEFLNGCNYNMPQVYWVQSHNPADQLRRSVAEFQGLAPFRQIIPVGAAFVERTWSPTQAEVIDFLRTAKELNLSGANFWEWSNCRRNLPEIWNTIRDYPWAPGPGAAQDITMQYIHALNTRNPERVLALYNPTAVHVNASRTVQGIALLRAWYSSLFTQILPEATFTHTGFSGSGSSRYFTWTAASKSGKVRNGSDTLGLINGKIAYHYTFFSVN